MSRLMVLAILLTGCMARVKPIPVDNAALAFLARNEVSLYGNVLAGQGFAVNTELGAAFRREDILVVCRSRRWPGDLVGQWMTFHGEADYVASTSSMARVTRRAGHFRFRRCQWTAGVHPQEVPTELIERFERSSGVVGEIREGGIVRVRGTYSPWFKGGPIVLADGVSVGCEGITGENGEQLEVEGIWRYRPPFILLESLPFLLLRPADIGNPWVWLEDCRRRPNQAP